MSMTNEGEDKFHDFPSRSVQIRLEHCVELDFQVDSDIRPQARAARTSSHCVCDGLLKQSGRNL